MSEQAAVPGSGPGPDGQQAATSSARSRPRWRQLRWVALTAVVVVASGAAFVVGQVTGSTGRTVQSRPAPYRPPDASSGCATRPALPAMTTPDATLGQFIGRQAGKAMAGNAPIAVSDAQLGRLGDQVPAGAHADASADRITFTATTATLAVEAAPATNPDMTFRVAGLVNPTIVVPTGAQVDIEFINADSDEAHAFEITSDAAPYAFRPGVPLEFAGSAAGPIGDPTSVGHGARDLTFQAGTYHYLCPMPGHAEMGMTGVFVVR